MRKRLNKIRIPLEDLTEDERKAISSYWSGGRYMVVIDKEPCLTCGHKKRLLHVERTDGRKELVKECLFCITKHHTSANRSGP